LGGAGEEDLLGVGGDDAVEGELARVLAAEFEEEAGAVAGVGIDGVDELHFRGAIEVGGVGDTLNRGLEVAETIVLRDDGDVAEGSAGAAGVGGVDVGCGAAVAQGVSLQLFVEERRLRRCGGGGTAGTSGCGSGFLYCGGRRWSGCCRGRSVGCQLRASDGLHLLEDGLVLDFVVPLEGEGMGVSVDGVGDGDHLVEIRGEAGEFG
jgi:hypothetical protein